MLRPVWRIKLSMFDQNVESLLRSSIDTLRPVGRNIDRLKEKTEKIVHKNPFSSKHKKMHRFRFKTQI